MIQEEKIPTAENIPKPIGDLLLNVPHVLTQEGAFYHYSVVCDLLKSQTAALNEQLEKSLSNIQHLQRLLDNTLEVGEELSERVKELESGETELQELFELRVKVKELEVTISKALEYVSKGLYFLAGAELEKGIENALKKKAQDENKNNIQEDPRSSS